MEVEEIVDLFAWFFFNSAGSLLISVEKKTLIFPKTRNIEEKKGALQKGMRQHLKFFATCAKMLSG